MMVQFWNFYYDCMRLVDRASFEDWLVVCFGVIVFGLFCMRGFGSRAKY